MEDFVSFAKSAASQIAVSEDIDMKDRFEREINYLRISVTDLCNLRCKYCMPKEGVCKKRHEEMISMEEMLLAVEQAASLGIKKLRVTGGEPLLKKNIIEICKNLAKIKGIETLCLTTNGTMLDRYASQLKEAGVSRINISLDSLNAKRFMELTGKDEIENVLSGIEAALKAGFEKVKINTVLMGGFNDDEWEDFAKLTLKYPLDVRFIELMPMNKDACFKREAFVSGDEALRALKGLKVASFDEVPVEEKDSVARLYKYENAKGFVGFISPVSSHFCGKCNRLRLTADGKLKPCLHSSEEFNLKGLNKTEMKEVLEKAILCKPAKHGDLSVGNFSSANRAMNCIGG